MADRFIIRNLRRGEVKEAGRVLAHSHQDDPAMSWVFPDPVTRAKALKRLFPIWIRDALPYGGVFAAVEGERILGAIVSLPPGKFPATFLRTLKGASQTLPLFAVAPRSFRTLLKYQNNAAEHYDRDEGIWYVEALGVEDGTRGAGVGRALFEHVLELIDSAGVPTRGETSVPGNVPWYSRLGFEMDDPAAQLVPGGGPTHSLMTRPARPA
jgi:GNAT superfamily N-acetyltransferase